VLIWKRKLRRTTAYRTLSLLGFTPSPRRDPTRPRVGPARLSRRKDGRFGSGIRTTQLRFDDFELEGSAVRRRTVTSPLPGSTVQTSESPISSPRMAATGEGTVVRIESDRLRALTAVDLKAFATPSPSVPVSEIRLGQHAGQRVDLMVIYSSRVGQHVGRLMLELPPRMSAREATALEMLASGARPQRTSLSGEYVVPDSARNGPFRVRTLDGPSREPTCDCEDFLERLAPCTHIFLVGHWLRAAAVGGPEGRFPVAVRRRARNWVTYNRAQTDEKRIFPLLLHNLCSELDEPLRDPHRAGRPPVPISDQVFCAIQKVHSKFSGRTSDGDRLAAAEAGLIQRAPRWDVTSRTLCDPETTPHLMELLARSAQPLRGIEDRAAIDSSGFRTTTFHHYRKERYNPSRLNVWLKGHVIVGVRTGIVIAAEITDGNAHDSPYFEVLLRRAREHGWELKEVLADKGYQGRKNFQVANELGIAAFVPFKKNQTGAAKGSATYHKMFLFFTYHREKFEEHYRDRNCVEVAFGAIKQKVGETIQSRNHYARVNELLCKLIVRNVTILIRAMAELGIAPDFLQTNSAQALGSAYAAGKASSTPIPAYPNLGDGAVAPTETSG
jgi:transposase